jgi:hypothetical protein
LLFAGPLRKGRQKKMKKTNQCAYVHTLFGKDFGLDARRDCFYRVFEFPLSRNAQKRNKKNR